MNPREYQSLFEVEDRHWWFVALRGEIARAFKKNLPPAAPNRPRWLDAGCGTGGLLLQLAAGGEALRVGCDSSLEALNLARSRGLRGLVCASADALPFASGGFDAVTSIDVLCHRGVRKEAALAEAFRCLAAGGILILQVPAFDWLRSQHDDAVWTDRRFRRAEVETLLAGAGLAPHKSFYRVGLLFPAAALRRLLSSRGRRAGAQARSDVRPSPFWLNALLGGVLRAESAIGAAGLRLPFGLSVFCVARKPAR